MIANTLDSAIWDNETLDSRVRAHLLLISKYFFKTLKLKTKIIDIILTGSLANYNYTSNSDIDLHVVIDFNDINCNLKITENFLLSKKSEWNNIHDIKIKGRVVELYVQDINEEHISSGVYSVLHNKWIKKPSHSNFYLYDINQEYVNKKYNNIKSIIDFNIKHKKNYNLLKKIKDNICNMRKKGLSQQGETDIKNIVFKKLRSKGYIDKLTKAINSSLDKKLSFENFLNEKI